MDHFSEKALQGIKLYNQRQYYEAHEYFEAAWRETSGESRELYRALLHMSGGFFRLSQGRSIAAKKFFTHALRWLDNFKSPYLGLKIETLKNHLTALIAAINQNEKSESILKNNFRPINPDNHVTW